MSEPVSYQLVTLKDVFDKVPAGSIRACLDELAKGMTYAKGLSDLAGAPLQWPESIDWIDDGKGEIDISITAGGKPVAKLEVRNNKQGKRK